MLLEIGLFKQKTKQNKKKKKQNKKKEEEKKKRHQNCIKSGLSQFLFLQQKMQYVALMAIFIYFFDYVKLLLFVNANVIHHV